MSSSNYTGIVAFGNQFRSQIFRCGRVHYLGLFDSPEEAALAYDRALKLSAPWNKRWDKVLDYNLGKEPVLPTEDQLSDQEKKLLTALRKIDPTREQAFQEKMSIEAQLPMEAVETFDRVMTKVKSMNDLLESAAGGLRSAYQAMAAKLKTREAYIEHLEKRNGDLEGQLKQQDDKEVGRKIMAGPNFMKRIIPGQKTALDLRLEAAREADRQIEAARVAGLKSTEPAPFQPGDTLVQTQAPAP